MSKIILDRINNDIRSSSRVNQWRSSTAVIEWFKAINEKNKHTFISFDIVDFYPSISEELLDKAISWASERTQITDQDISIIKHARGFSLNMFDVTMGSNDGAEVCELIGLYILNRLSEKYGKDNVGLYRDDGLILLKNVTGRLAEKAKKDMMQIFEEFNLKTIATANQKITNLLDITLNLSNGTSYQPLKKPNDDYFRYFLNVATKTNIRFVT